MHTLGAEILDIAPGHCTLTAPISPVCTQQHGYAHAGASFALGDSACGYAALSLQASGVEVLSSEMKIHLLAPARGARLVAQGRVVKSGRRLVITQADVFAEDGKDRTHVALVLGTVIPVPT